MSKPANADVRSLWASWYEPVAAAPGLPVPVNQNTPPAIADNDNRPALAGSYDGTLAALVDCYLTDPVSPFHITRHFTKISYRNLCRRLVAEHGDVRIAELKYRSLLEWQRSWAATGQVAMTHALFAMLRITIRFGSTILEQQDCERASAILHSLRVPVAKPRRERITLEQVLAVCDRAYEAGRPSIAMAQKLQFAATLRQKDVIGEWVPMSEPGTTDIFDGQKKWLRGIRWEEIDDNLILRHVTSKRQKEIVVDLTVDPLVFNEIQRIGHKPTSGPVIVSETTRRPYTAHEFRRHWRNIATAAGVPANVRNMDSRAGAITEAAEAGVPLSVIQHAAAHSSTDQTADYARVDAARQIRTSMEARVAARKQVGS
ncbi:tyrosine-type recombinase/integrase [Pseudorhodoplanes sinuspersici]|uniref:Uncharacterized protein n=1 Tax=Pseudorhodoplanes sinuspersici TaxID=1235591 RepID=A0A1W6ZX22_9HYPH|nr:tyrosine-type recombinase/integrase [Pseudorhodoplanes sinuspersici]ARQ01860.1 hypothetical protein CAK95_24270 [Pseudorhodoplanes sinuspersici]RKE73624.1 phage integrase family protein [Pseudorhodoplanes sinuspersici]